MQPEWGDYIIYVDESGDHSLKSIDPEYPVFVLACCIFEKQHYTNTIIPAFPEFKFNQWGHDIVVLHEREIRQKTGDFDFLFNREKSIFFMQELSHLINTTSLTLVAAVIDKINLKEKYSLPENPYELALKFCLERIWFFLQEKQQTNKITHLVVESRGKKEDNELELAFRRVCNGDNQHNCHLPIKLIFSKKEPNAVGLQLADLFARPIGRQKLDPSKSNRAYTLIEQKFHRNPQGEMNGYGLKYFP